MITPTPRDRRLNAELEHLRELEKHSDFFRFEKIGERFPPEEYRATFTCRGIVRKPEPGISILECIGEEHQMDIYLPAGYPLQPPQIYLRTPIFHPNIKYLTDWEKDVEEKLGGAANKERRLHLQPGLRDQIRHAHARLICLDGIKPPKEGGNFVPRITLYDICRELGEMIMLQRYNLDDPLDQDAWNWTRQAEKVKYLLPIDKRPFLNRLEVILKEQANETEIEIQLQEEPIRDSI